MMNNIDKIVNSHTDQDVCDVCQAYLDVEYLWKQEVAHGRFTRGLIVEKVKELEQENQLFRESIKTKIEDQLNLREQLKRAEEIAHRAATEQNALCQALKYCVDALSTGKNQSNALDHAQKVLKKMGEI